MLAVDEHDPLLRGEVPVTVSIEDVNDHSPVFEFPAAENRTFKVSSAVPPGFPVVTVDAYDDDAGENSRLSYDVVSLDDEQQTPLFRINRFSDFQKLKVETEPQRVRSLYFRRVAYVYSAPLCRESGSCDEYVCLCVCLSGSISQKPHACLTFTEFSCLLPTTVARSSSSGVPTRYVFPVLSIASCS